MKIEIVHTKQPKMIRGEQLSPGDFFTHLGEIFMVISDPDCYLKDRTGYGEPWAISLKTHELTYFAHDEEYFVYEQVSPTQFKVIYE